MLPSFPARTVGDSAASSAAEYQQTSAHESSSEARARHETIAHAPGDDGQVPVLYSVAPQFQETVFLPSSNDSRPSLANTVAPSPATSAKLEGGLGAVSLGSASGQAGGNALDGPVFEGAAIRRLGTSGAAFLGNLAELKPGLTPMQQAMQKRAKAGLKADLEKQVSPSRF